MRVRPTMSTLTHPFSSLAMQCNECPCASVAQVAKALAARDGLGVKIVSPCLVRFTIGVIIPFLPDFHASALRGGPMEAFALTKSAWAAPFGVGPSLSL